MKWNISTESIDEYDSLNVSNIFKKILKNRDIDPDTAKRLIDYPMSLIDMPSEIPGAEAAAKRIFELSHEQKPFVVFADYDVDGMTAGYIMTDFLLKIGCMAMVKYPERNDGYGLSVEFAQELIQSGADLTVITVDNGITAIKPIKLLKQHGIETIVTDHHERGAVLPDCIICDPWLDTESEKTTGKALCGAAVAWKVCTLVEAMLEEERKCQINICESYLPFVGIGTVADVMPMNEENRALVKIALAEINKRNPHVFIKSMKNSFDLNHITAKDIAWSIAPKLNSASRMGNTQLAAMSFFGQTEGDIYNNLIEVARLDKQRKALSDKAIEEALSTMNENDSVCIFDGSDYPHGINGIIAGRLAEQYGKPAIVYFTNGTDELQCSCRSVPWLDLKSLINLETRKGYAGGAMGHAQACGAILYESKLAEFVNDTNAVISELIENLPESETEDTVIDIDAVVSLDEINKTIFQEINIIPYTKDIPLLAVKNVRVKELKPFKTDKGHLILEMSDGTQKAYAVGWYMGEEYKALGAPNILSIAGELEPARFMAKHFGIGYNDPILMIKYLKTPEKIILTLDN